MTDLIPAPRPVPTREDRMRHATADTTARAEIDQAITAAIDAHTAAYHPGLPCVEDDGDRCAALPPADRSFATYLDARERDQLDARAATAEAERDEALDDLRETRAKLAVVTGERDERLTLAESSRLAKRYDEAIAVRAALRAHLDAIRAELVDAHAYLTRRGLDDVAQVRLLAEQRDTAKAERDQARRQLGAATDALATIRDAGERIDRALATWETTPEAEQLKHVSVLGHCIACRSRCPNGRCPNGTPPVLGSPSPRAQEPTAGEARRLLDQAIDTALPLAGRSVRKLLKALRRELARVDAGRAPAEARP